MARVGFFESSLKAGASLAMKKLMDAFFMKKTYLFALFVLFATATFGQKKFTDEELFLPHFSLQLGYHFPEGDMASRFGNCGSVGAAFQIKTKKNFYFGLESGYLFGNTVREPGLIQNLFTDAGEVLDVEGKIAVVSIQQRGVTALLTGGKLFDFIGPNPNSGLLVKAGVGFMQHKIRLEHRENRIPQLEDEYLKGYDRLTNGLAISQFVGYYHLSNNRLTNFYFGFEVVEGFTQGRRTFNFDTMTVDNAKRLDILYGARLGWVIPVYKRPPEDVYYY